ncbi:hypothetical protein RYX36_010330, partial [Vicia faba]
MKHFTSRTGFNSCFNSSVTTLLSYPSFNRLDATKPQPSSPTRFSNSDLLRSTGTPLPETSLPLQHFRKTVKNRESE